MLTIQRKTGFSGITYSFMKDGALIAPHVPGLLLSQAIAKMYGSSLPVTVVCADGTEQEKEVVMRSVVKTDPMVDSESFVDMCIILECGSAYAEVPLIALHEKLNPQEKSVKRVYVRSSEKLEAFLLEARDSIERQSLYEMLCESPLREVRHVMRFLELPIRGGEELEDHVDEIVDKTRADWHDKFFQNELKVVPDMTFTDMAREVIAYMENKDRVDSSLSLELEDEDEEDFDFEDEAEIFTEEFDGDNIIEDLSESGEEDEDE